MRGGQPTPDRQTRYPNLVVFRVCRPGLPPLLAGAKDAVSPGFGFGGQGDGNVWIALVENDHQLGQAVRNIRGFPRAGSNMADGA